MVGASTELTQIITFFHPLSSPPSPSPLSLSTTLSLSLSRTFTSNLFFLTLNVYVPFQILRFSFFPLKPRLIALVDEDSPRLSDPPPPPLLNRDHHRHHDHRHDAEIMGVTGHRMSENYNDLNADSALPNALWMYFYPSLFHIHSLPHSLFQKSLILVSLSTRIIFLLGRKSEWVSF